VWADGLLASAHSWPSRCDIALVQPGAGRITGIPASRARVLALEEPYRAPRGAFPVERQPEGWHPVSQESLASGAPRTSRPRHRRDVRPSRIQPGRCHIAPELAPPDVPGASLLRAGPCKAMPVPARQCRSLQGNAGPCKAIWNAAIPAGHDTHLEGHAPMTHRHRWQGTWDQPGRHRPRRVAHEHRPRPAVIRNLAGQQRITPASRARDAYAASQARKCTSRPPAAGMSQPHPAPEWPGRRHTPAAPDGQEAMRR
jgi:hypothetical protein